MPCEVNNGVPHELPWPVECDIPPSLNLPDVDPTRLQEALLHPQMSALGPSPQGDYRGMF